MVDNAAPGIPNEISRKSENKSPYELIEFLFFYLGDFEFSVITNERQNVNESDASSDDGRLIFSTFRTYSIELIIWELNYSSKVFICLEQRLLHESLQHVRSGNGDDLTGNIDHRGLLDIFIFLIRI